MHLPSTASSRNIDLLSGAIDGLEQILRRAEVLNDKGCKRALPFLGLIWLYASAMRDVLHARRDDGSMLWNAPGLAALCRPLLDAFLSLIYFAIETPEAEEAEFRQLLLSRHMVFKRWDLLRRADRSSAEIAAEHQIAQAEWKAVNETVLAHPHWAKLERNVAKKLASDGERYIPEPLDAVWARAGLPPDLYGCRSV